SGRHGDVTAGARPRATPRAAARLAGARRRGGEVKEGNAKFMSRCETIRSQMFFYLDDELHGRELSDFEQHLEDCLECRSLCDQERCVIESVRAARPLYTASPELRDRIADLLEQSPEPYVASKPLRGRVRRILGFDQRPAAARLAAPWLAAPRFAVPRMLALACVLAAV